MKKKKWVKGLIIGGASLLGLLLLLIIIPLCFQNRIAQRVLKESDRFLNAKVTMEHFHLSLIRHFPNPTLVLKDVTIENVGEFKGVKLLQVDEFTASVNLFSLFSDTYKIKTVIADNPRVRLISTATSSNWDILKPSDEKEEEKESSGFNFKFDKIVLNHADISYKDVPGKMYARLKDLDFSLSGKLSNDFTTLKTALTSKSTDFKLNGIKYLSQANFKLKANIDADFVKSKYTIKDNSININALTMNLQGWLALPKDGMDMDIKLNVAKIDFKDIISLIPAIYAKDFEKIKTAGKVALSAYAKGKMTGNSYPAFNAQLKIDDAMFRYPSLPASVDNINIDAKVNSPGGPLDKMNVDINKFHFVIAKNPFDLTAHIATPLSDPNVSATLKGILDFGQIKNIYPLENGVEMSGKFSMDLALAGRLSYVEKGLYEKFKASGAMSIANLLLKNLDLFEQNVAVSSAKLSFTSAYANLENFVANIGNNDITIKGKVENYIPYIFSDGTLKGNLNVSSTNLNVNDLLSSDDDEATANESDTSSATLFHVPNNLNVSANLAVKNLQYDNIKMKNANLICAIKDSKLTLQNLGANLFSGKIDVNGDYQNPSYNKGFANVNLNVNTISTRNVCETFGIFEKFLPVLKNADGDISWTLKGNSYLNNSMSPEYASMNAEGEIGLLDVHFTNIETLNKINDLLKIANLKTLSLKDVKVAYKIKDGKMTTQPFSFKVAKANIDVEKGTIGLDKTMHYVAIITMPSSMLNKDALNLAKSLVKKSKIKNLDINSADEVKFAVTIDGTLNKPQISVGLNEARTAMKEAVTEKVDDVKQQAQTAVDNAKNQAIEAAQKKADALIQEAQAKADALVAAQKKANDKIIDNAKAEAQKMIDAAKNPLEKAAKKKAAELLIAEAEQKAAKLNSETQTKANKLVSDAQREGNKLIEAARK